MFVVILNSAPLSILRYTGFLISKRNLALNTKTVSNIVGHTDFVGIGI